MKTSTILIIDDSTTIRRLADSNLSRAGYNVVLAPNAEEGIRLAGEVQPDLILLDHQLPGTTGFQVCQKLLAADVLGHIPVVVSSTLRNKAYAEYSELPNVVDMLPKPYTEDLLLTTIANALDTGALIVSSQSRGAAVPEVIEQMEDIDISGSFAVFSVREVVDLLNNGRKQGVLEIEAGHNRYWIYLANGRVQGVTASGVSPTTITDCLPDSLRELAPVMELTLSRGGSEVGGLVDLLNTNVLDPRLLRRLLRHQAAVLLLQCYTQPLNCFRFDTKRSIPTLYQKLPLDVSALALLIEGSERVTVAAQQDLNDDIVLHRQQIRGQNLDRAGLSAEHAKILNRLNTNQTLTQLAHSLAWSVDTARRVVFGLLLVDLVQAENCTEEEVVVFAPDTETARRLRPLLTNVDGFRLRVLDDWTTVRLLVKRTKPKVMVLPAEGGLVAELRSEQPDWHPVWIGTGESGHVDPSNFNAVLPVSFTKEELLLALASARSRAARLAEPVHTDAEGEAVACHN